MMKWGLDSPVEPGNDKEVVASHVPANHDKLWIGGMPRISSIS